MKKNRSKFIIISLSVVSVILASVGVTFAYFTTIILNQESETSLSLSSAIVAINFENGTNQIDAANIVPGWQGTKNFTLSGSNTTNLNASYDIYLVIVENTFLDEGGRLTFNLIGTGAGAVNNSGYIPSNISEETSLKLGTATLNPNQNSIVHEYSLIISYPNINGDQNENQGARFAGYINISGEDEGHKLY